MGICTICKRTSEEVALYPGIQSSEMVNICEDCAEEQKVPIIKKPSDSQLAATEKTYSVRERLDQMGGRRDTTEISGDQMITQRNLAKLKMPKPKQSHPDVQENYYWTLIMARRRAKMTVSQLAKKIDVESHIIQDIEKGIIPENFKEIFLKLESLLGIKLLIIHEPQVKFRRENRDQEREILEEVSRKMKEPEEELEELEEDDEMIKVHEKIEREELKLSRKKDIENVTLSDLIDRKRAREKSLSKAKHDELIGDEVDFEEL